MVTQIIGISASQEHFFSPKTSSAARLGPAERKGLSLQVLMRSEPVSHLAQNYRVSRKFLYQQATKASDAFDEAFTPSITAVLCEVNVPNVLEKVLLNY